VDLQTCLTDEFWNIPYRELWRGYYGVMGGFVPRLPDERLTYYAPGSFLTGNATRYDQGLMDWKFHQTIDALGLDPSLYLGGIALDSCGYQGYTAWVEIPGLGVSAGPFLVSDCRNLIHKFEAACQFGTVVEMVYEFFGQTENRRIDNVLVSIAAPGNVIPPAPPAPSDFIDYPSAWLNETGMSCQSLGSPAGGLPFLTLTKKLTLPLSFSILIDRCWMCLINIAS